MKIPVFLIISYAVEMVPFLHRKGAYILRKSDNPSTRFLLKKGHNQKKQKKEVNPGSTWGTIFSEKTKKTKMVEIVKKASWSSEMVTFCCPNPLFYSTEPCHVFYAQWLFVRSGGSSWKMTVRYRIHTEKWPPFFFWGLMIKKVKKGLRSKKTEKRCLSWLYLGTIFQRRRNISKKGEIARSLRLGREDGRDVHLLGWYSWMISCMIMDDLLYDHWSDDLEALSKSIWYLKQSSITCARAPYCKFLYSVFTKRSSKWCHSKKIQINLLTEYEKLVETRDFLWFWSFWSFSDDH